MMKATLISHASKKIGLSSAEAERGLVTTLLLWISIPEIEVVTTPRRTTHSLWLNLWDRWRWSGVLSHKLWVG